MISFRIFEFCGYIFIERNNVQLNMEIVSVILFVYLPNIKYRYTIHICTWIYGILNIDIYHQILIYKITIKRLYPNNPLRYFVFVLRFLHIIMIDNYSICNVCIYIKLCTMCLQYIFMYIVYINLYCYRHHRQQ